MTRSKTSLYESQAGSSESDSNSSDAKSVKNEKTHPRGRHAERIGNASNVVEAN